jgi:hypothetical protein
MLHRGMRKAFGLLLMVVLATAIGVVVHADGPTPGPTGTITILCHQQWEGNICP